MDIPTIYASNVGVLFTVSFVAFSAIWGVVKLIKLFKELHK